MGRRSSGRPIPKTSTLVFLLTNLSSEWAQAYHSPPMATAVEIVTQTFLTTFLFSCRCTLIFFIYSQEGLEKHKKHVLFMKK